MDLLFMDNGSTNTCTAGMILIVQNPRDLDSNKIVIKKPCIAGFLNSTEN
jgi:hypothetical protein